MCQLFPITPHLDNTEVTASSGHQLAFPEIRVLIDQSKITHLSQDPPLQRRSNGANV